MGLMMLADATESTVLWLFLLAALGLTYWECRDRHFENKITRWWLLLVLLTHVPGYIILRIWGFTQDRKNS